MTFNMAGILVIMMLTIRCASAYFESACNGCSYTLIGKQMSFEHSLNLMQQMLFQQNSNFSKTVEDLLAVVDELNKTVQDQCVEIATLRANNQQLNNTVHNLQIEKENNSFQIAQLQKNDANLEQDMGNLTRDLSSSIDEVRLKIDNLTNTEHAKIAFTVSLNDHFNVSNDDDRLMFDKIITDVDGRYNVTNGEFCPPVHGIYFFSLTIRGQKQGRAKIKRNHGGYGWALAFKEDGWTGTGSVSVALELYPWDTVYVICTNAGDRFQAIATYFTGHLLFSL